MAHGKAASRPPQLAIIAGPNGSGKSSLYELTLRDVFPVWVNADEIALTLGEVPEANRNLVAAQRAEDSRQRLLEEGASFAFETVFSRTDHWMDFMGRAKHRGHEIQLFFICTEHPDLNAARVQTRVGRGGHPVPLGKVVSRYPRSIQTALKALRIVDELWLYDNSLWDWTPRLVGAWRKGASKYRAKTIPRWAEPFFRPGPL